MAERRTRRQPRLGFALGVAALLALLAPLLVSASGAQAAFPGENGRIAFSSSITAYPNSTPTCVNAIYCQYQGIFAMNPNGSDAKQLTDQYYECHDNLYCGHHYDTDATFSPTGKRISFARFNEQREFDTGVIYLMDSDGTHLKQLTQAEGYNADPAFSPNGGRIAFGRGPFGPAFKLKIMRADGTHRHQLPGFGRDPSFFPSGKRIVFDNPSTNIATERLDGTHRRVLTHNDESTSPDISPNGKKIVYSRQEQGLLVSGVHVMRADGSHKHRLAQSGFTPVFSPDGRRIAFTRYPPDSSQTEIIVMKADGSDQHPISPDPPPFGAPAASSGSPAWGPLP